MYEFYTKAIVKPAITILTIDINLIRIFNEGPEVSLKGSPTVSPTIHALCAKEPLPPKLPSSIFFLALSHAPPELACQCETAGQATYQQSEDACNA